MSDREAPRLVLASVLALVREGGFAALPGLERPRRIVFRELNARQRARLQALLDDIERLENAGLDTGARGNGSADRRRFRLTLERPESGPRWQCELDEEATPRILVGLWKHGPDVLDE